ncbi:hypothetical protein [Algoriphagus namhaensis]
MTDQINSNYLEKYASNYALEVCNRYFSNKQYISGQDILSLTNSTQVNFFVLKTLFGLWQEELEKLKSNPFFDYRDITVHEALTQFMNVLSKRIKVERSHFEPLLRSAVKDAVQVATDPVTYYQSEIQSAPEGQVNEHLKENKKYYKWHLPVINFLIDKAGFGLEKEPYLRAIAANFQAIQSDLESVNLLLATLGDVAPFDLDAYWEAGTVTSPKIEEEDGDSSPSFFDQLDEQPQKSQEATPQPAPRTAPTAIADPKPTGSVPSSGKALHAAALKRQFESESYTGMKSVVATLSEGLAINQRFMFTKELFDGNSDLMMHTLKQLDSAGDFEGAIALINDRYFKELSWDVNSEPVQEFLQLVYRRFDD